MGDDYPTPDGTCIRDYIHVSDLASAHVLAVERLCRGGDGEGLSLNLGTGTGISVRAILTAAEQVAGRHLDCAVGSRRPGDPPLLVADGSRARNLLGWSAQRSSMETILADAWNWHTSGRAIVQNLRD